MDFLSFCQCLAKMNKHLIIFLLVTGHRLLPLLRMYAGDHQRILYKYRFFTTHHAK